MKQSNIFILLLMVVFNTVKSQVRYPNQTPFAYGVSAGIYSSSAKPNQAIILLDRKPVAGFSIGGVASFRKSKYFLETGFNYISEGYAYSSTIAYKNTFNNVSNEYKFYSLMVPLKLAIPVQGTFCKHLPSIAFNLSVPIKQTLFQSVEYNNSPRTKNVYDVRTDYNLITPSVSLAYGVEFDMDMTYALRFEPTVQFSFINAKSQMNKTTINNIGLKCSFLFLR